MKMGSLVSVHNITTFLLLTILLLPNSLSTSPPAAAAPAAAPTRRFSKIYAFGDSYTDTGNTHSTTGPYSFGYVSSSPYGATFFHHSTNRYSDGRLVVDFLASALGLHFLPPYLSRRSDFSRGVNFAVAGSTAIEHEFYAKRNVTIDIVPQSIMTQLAWFEHLLQEKGCRGRQDSPQCEAAIDGALFWVGEIGANDYAYSFTSPSLSPDLIRSLAITNVFNFLEALLNRGAKYIVVQGLPLTGCLPLSMTLAPTDDRDAIGCAASVNKQSHTHNVLLLQKIRELRQRHPAAVISYADYYAAHHAVMKNPDAFGFKEAFKTCCGSGGGAYNFDIFATCGSPAVTGACSDPARFINWDGVHLTEAMYKAVADLFFRRGYLRPAFDVLVGGNSH